MAYKPSKSRFRPAVVLDRSALDDDRKLIDQIGRRHMLKGSLGLGALSLLSGCSLSEQGGVKQALQAINRLNDNVQGLIFRPNHLAPTFSQAQVIKPPRFNAFYDPEDVKPVDGARWKLELAGLIADKTPWTMPMMAAMPQQELIIRHICVEGWDYIGQWSGVNFRTFLERVGADLRARYIGFRCADGYTSSIDMATALHPQTILATQYAREPIADPFGFPMRLRTSTKLGFKNPKWITAIEITNTYPGGYWEDQGFNWFSGI